MDKNKQIVVIGGGTGTFNVLSGLKKYPVDLSAVVSMADSGGSTGRLRDQLGVLPPGDVRQCLVALSESDSLMREMFSYRFEEGDLKGHSVGNLLISGLKKITGNFEEAVIKTGEILRIKGKVIPVTVDQTHLCAIYDDGTRANSEAEIDEPEDTSAKKIVKVSLDPPAKITHNAAHAILDADMIVIGPGDMYTSLGQCLVVRGVVEAIRKSKAIKVYNVNLMTKLGQTQGMSAKQHVDTIEGWLGKGTLDHVLINNKTLPEEEVEVYELVGETPVKDDISNNKKVSYNVECDDFLANDIAEKQRADAINRSLIRHNSDKIAEKLISLIS